MSTHEQEENVVSVEELLMAEVSSFADVKNTTPEGPVKLKEVLSEIKEGKYKSRVERVRSYDILIRRDKKHPEHESYRQAKTSLPAVTFGGNFRQRKNSELIQSSGLLVIDIDGKDNDIDTIEEATLLSGLIFRDPHVFAAWVSPSGDGVKFLVYIGCRECKEGVADADAYFSEKFNRVIDKACKDRARLCFMSFDPKIWVKKDSVLELPKRSKEAKENASHPKDLAGEKQSAKSGSTNSDDYPEVSIDEIGKMLNCIPADPPYDDWIKIISAVSSALSYGEALEVLEEWSPDYGDQNYEEKLDAGLDRCTIGTLVYYAKQHGYRPPQTLIRKLAKEGPKDFPEPRSLELCDTEVNGYIDREQRGDAELIARLYKHRVAFDAAIKKWRYYSFGAWCVDEFGYSRLAMTGAIIDTYAGYREKLHESIYKDVADGKLPRNEIDNDSRMKQCGFLSKREKKLHGKRYIDEVVDLARSLMSKGIKDWECDPSLFNLENGTYNLETHQVQDHRPEDYLIRMAGVAYDPEAACPKFRKFVSLICENNLELEAFLQKALGYSMTADCSEDVLFFCYGSGRNGKTTLFEVLFPLHKDYMLKFNTECILTQGRGGRDTTADAEKMKLFGIRLALGSELPSQRRLNEAVVKDLTGGDRVVARALYCEPVAFSPSHKLWLFGNDKPVIYGVDHGIWRRMILIPFNHQFPASDEVGYRDKKQVLKELRSELPGILNWLLEGLKSYQREGLNPPKIVTEAVEEYRSESDVLTDFLEHCIVRTDNGSFVPNLDLWNHYSKYTENEQRVYRSPQSLSKQLASRGYERSKKGGERGFINLRLR